jgi:hypothetical protein
VVSFYNEPLEDAFKKEYTSQLPRVQRTSIENGEAQVLDPAIAICFDQRIDSSEVVKHIQVSTSQWRFKSAGTVALVGDEEVKVMRATILRTAQFLDDKPDQCLVFRCSEPFAPKTKVTVKIDQVPARTRSI